MKYILILALTYSIQAVECKLAPMSLYSVSQKKSIKMRSKQTFTIKDHGDYLLVNNKRYDLKSDGNIKTYVRGRFLIFKDEDGQYYIKKQPSHYTGWLKCK